MEIRNKIIRFVPACLLAAVFSCSQIEYAGPGEHELVFGEVGVGTEEPLTKAYSPFPTDSSFRVNLAAVAGVYEAVNGRAFSYVGGKWSASPVINLRSTQSTLTAWAPTALEAIDTLTNPNLFALTPGLYSRTKDLVYAQSRPVNAVNHVVSVLRLDRAYAMLTIKYDSVTTGSTYPGAANMTALSVKGAFTDATLDIGDGTLTANPTKGNVDVSTGLINQRIPEGGVAVLLVPDATATGLKVSCTLDGNVYDLALPGITALKAGVNYTVTLQLMEGIGLFIKSISIIEEWLDGADLGEETIE